MLRFTRLSAIVSAAACMFWLHGSPAQTARPSSGPSAQVLQQMQQLASERTSLQAENAKLKQDLESMRKERDALKQAQKGVDRRVQASEASLKALEENAAQKRQATERETAANNEKTQQLIAKFKETVQSLRETETDRSNIKQTLATRDQELKVCIDRNLALFKLNGEILTRMEHPGAMDRVARAEPFTQIKRVQLENLVDEYRGRAEDQQVKPAAASDASAQVSTNADKAPSP